MLDTLGTLVDYLQAFLGWLWRQALQFARSHPWAAAAALFAVARMFGTVVETGWRGVLFSFGRVRKELEPGFHWLVPLVHHVAKVRVRSQSIDLPRQRIATRDGLVYDVDANVIYRIEDPKAAVVEVDDVDLACRTIIPLVIGRLLGEQASLQRCGDGAAEEFSHDLARLQLDSELTARVQQHVGRWGVVIEHAGLQSIAPTRETLRITQIRLRAREKARMYQALLEEGHGSPTALALLGAPAKLVEKSVVRRRGYVRRQAHSRRLAELLPAASEPALKVGDRIAANWLELGEYYPGVVTKLAGEQVHVAYDDGETEVVHLRNVRRMSDGPKGASRSPG